MPDMAHLENLIKEECHAVLRFIDLLKEEEKALTSLTPEGLDLLGDKKLTLLKEIEAFEKKRAENLNEETLKNPAIAAQNAELLKLAEEVKLQNQQNGKRLMRHLERTAEALATLMQKENPSLYGKKGQTEAPSAGRDLGSA